MKSKEDKVVKDNKALISVYPFLLPRNRWTGRVVEDYDYSWTELDAMPGGWRKAFGIDLCRDLKEALVKSNMLDKYRISQIKEKYGSLRWYDFGNTKEGYEVIDRYEKLSEETCIACGDKATRISIGWISPFCDSCGSPLVKYQSIEDLNKDDEVFLL